MGAGTGTGCGGRSGSGGQPGPALQRQEDRDGQGPAEDRHAAAAVAVETRLGTIEGGFTWGDLWVVGVGPREPLDQDVAVLVEVWWALCKDRGEKGVSSGRKELSKWIIWQSPLYFLLFVIPRNISVSYLRISGSTVILKGLLSLTRTWIKATHSDGLRLTVQTQADGVVSGVAQSLPLLRPITACHWALGTENVNRSTQNSGDHNIQNGAKAQQWITPLSASFYCIGYWCWISACLPGTTVQPSTGWDRGVGCRICASQAGCRCSACCGWCAWCCRPAAERSWPSGLASPSSRRACCSSATPLSPSWRTMQKKF